MERTAIPKSTHQERPIFTWNGFVALVIGLALVGYAAWRLIQTVQGASLLGSYGVVASLVWTALLFIAGALVLGGLYTLQPTEAAILQLFGSYRGTTRVAGLRGTNRFTRDARSPARAQPQRRAPKVNDKRGNPIEIAAVVVWRVDDTAKASFDVDNYENYVKLQSEAAVRHLASSFAYDHGELTLTGSPNRRC
jgi:hypothetical protein